MALRTDKYLRAGLYARVSTEDRGQDPETQLRPLREYAERVKAGMARAKAQGKRTSRPPIPEATRRRIAELYAQGVSVKRIAKELKIAYGTAWNYAKGARGRLI